jgi:hypothetical protein
MKKGLVIFLLLIFLFSGTPLFSETLPAYVPYEKDEFPLWTYKLRRAESLFFGSLVLTFPIAVLSYNLAVNYLSFSEASSDLNALLLEAGIASALSLGISVADFIIGEVQGQ